MTRQFDIRNAISLAIVSLGLLLAACSSESPIQYATEDPRQHDGSAPTLQSIIALPTVQGVQLPTVAAAVSTPTNFGQDFGPIIGPEYEQPPTSTQRPTRAPSPAPIIIPSTQAGSAHTTPLPADQTRLDSSQMGIQVHYFFDVADWDRTLRQIAPLRLGWIKLQASWKWLQPDRAGQFDANFRLFQFHVQEADKRGFKVMLSIAKAPPWARNTNRNEDGPPDNLDDLKWFVHKLLEVLGPHIDAIEIWNEPNLRREWSGNRPMGGSSYMELFRIGYDAVRAYSPHITVVTAGLAPTGNLNGVSVDDRAFLRQMYQAGLAGYSDVKIGVHPYGWGNPPDFLCCDKVPGQGWDDRPQFFFQQTIRDYAAIIAAGGDNAQMWITEFGWATWENYPSQAPETWMTYNSALDQRDYAMRAFQIGQARADIGLMFLWNLSYAEEFTVRRQSELAGYSILYPAFDGSDNRKQRPLYRALADRP